MCTYIPTYVCMHKICMNTSTQVHATHVKKSDQNKVMIVKNKIDIHLFKKACGCLNFIHRRGC